MPESGIKFGSYEARSISTGEVGHRTLTAFKGSKRIAARLEGHDNPRALGALSQFLAAGMGGVIAQ